MLTPRSLTANRDLRDIIEAARTQGWRVERNNGHLKWFASDGKGLVTTASTPSDHRALRNIIGELRRRGFIWEGR